MYGIDELLQRYRTRVILVEYLKDALSKKGLRKGRESRDKYLWVFRVLNSISPTFLEVTIFWNSSRRISCSFPTVLRNSCSSRANELLSKPVRGLKQTRLILLNKNNDHLRKFSKYRTTCRTSCSSSTLESCSNTYNNKSLLISIEYFDNKLSSSSWA